MEGQETVKFRVARGLVIEDGFVVFVTHVMHQSRINATIFIHRIGHVGDTQTCPVLNVRRSHSSVSKVDYSCVPFLVLFFTAPSLSFPFSPSLHCLPSSPMVSRCDIFLVDYLSSSFYHFPKQQQKLHTTPEMLSTQATTTNSIFSPRRHT